jgi:nucleotide-binding universal stress UspA family protein
MEYPVFPLCTILHPTDFSERSELAFQVADTLARDTTARLIVLHVGPPTELGSGEALVSAAVKEQKDRLWARLVRYQPSSPSIGVEYQLVEGDPAQEIVRLAKTLPCDLIVMGTHGRTGLGRALLGSVAEAVLRHAPYPVLTVKAPRAAEPHPAEPAHQETEVVR